MELPDKVYDILKWISLTFLPAIAALYYGLGNIWGFPYIEQIVGTIAVIETFIGALIGLSTISYNKSKENE